MRCLTRIAAVTFTAALVSPAYAQQEIPPDSPTTLKADAAQEPGSENGFVKKARAWAEEVHLAERLSGDIDGWYPRLGGMTRGSGFALGPGYRLHVGRVRVDGSAAITTKAYKAADLKVRWLQALEGRFELWTDYRFEDFPQEDFYGLGLASRNEDRTSYDFDSSTISAQGVLSLLPWLRTGVTVGYMSPEIGPGADRNYPSIEELFTDGQAPGLLEQPNFLHTTFMADIDYRDQRGRPRKGGLYQMSMGFWDDRTLSQYDFRRFDATATQWVPLDSNKKHVVLGRLGASYVNNETSERVPFYFLAYVGGIDTIRGFREFRFKDENAMWMTAEYNYSPIKWVSVAAFIDAGKVSPDWEANNLSELKKGYGFGFRVHSNKQTFARFDFGTGGGEGWQLFMKVGPSL